MKSSKLSLASILDQLSEDHINLVVDSNDLRAAGGSKKKKNTKKSHKSHSSKSSKSKKSHKSHHSGYVCW